MNGSAALCNKCITHTGKLRNTNATFCDFVLVQSVGFVLTENFELSLPIEMLSLTMILLLHHHAVGVIIVRDHHVVTVIILLYHYIFTVVI
jgi:hypothetical protein